MCMRAFQAMKYDSLETFVSSVIELKLDRSSMFVWQTTVRIRGKYHRIPICWNLLIYALGNQKTLHERAIGSMTARNPLSTHTWLMFKIVVWHVMQNINYINVGIFAPCLTIGKMGIVKKIMLYA